MCTVSNGTCPVRSARVRELAFGDFGRAPTGVPAYPPETDRTDIAAATANRQPVETMVRKYNFVPTDDEGREIRPDVPVRDPEREAIYAGTLNFLRERYPSLATA